MIAEVILPILLPIVQLSLISLAAELLKDTVKYWWQQYFSEVALG